MGNTMDNRMKDIAYEMSVLKWQGFLLSNKIDEFMIYKCKICNKRLVGLLLLHFIVKIKMFYVGN